MAELDIVSSALDAPSDAYLYQPLIDAGNIRLLSIHEGNGPIHVSLTEAALHGSSYDALSYTWGSPIGPPNGHVHTEATRFIYCDNKRHRVTENLFSALVQFRAFEWKGPFWIDAVCIDQGNFSERSSQVRMMGDIYANSGTVIIWLGESDSDTEEAVSLITEFANAVPKLSLDLFTWNKLIFNDPKFYEETGLKTFAQSQWEVIVRFLKRRWFRRLWVLQEIVLGNGGKVVIGHYTLEFDALFLTVVFIVFSGWAKVLAPMALHTNTEGIESQTKGHMRMGMLLLPTAMNLGQCKEDGPEYPANKRHLEREYGAKDPYERRYAYLANVIHKSRIFDAQDPRDLIFAPLSLVSRFVPPRQQPHDWIIPDYSQTVTSVFTSVSTLLIKKLPIIQLISEVEDPKERHLSELPSWVPDFSCLKSTVSLSFHCKSNIYEGLDYCDDREERFESTTHLRTSGIIHDTVKNVSGPIMEDLENHTFDSLLEIASMLPKLGRNGQGRLEVLWRTLVADSYMPLTDDERNFPAPVEMAEPFYHWFCSEMAMALVYSRTANIEDEVFWQNHATYEKFAREEKLPNRREISKHADDLTSERRNSDVSTDPVILSETSNTVWDILMAMQRVIGGRSLLITESGNLGLGTESTQPGDVVAFIRNTKVPFILRLAQTGYYNTIGEAYIHGFMHGEIVKEGPLKFQQIILQ